MQKQTNKQTMFTLGTNRIQQPQIIWRSVLLTLNHQSLTQQVESNNYINLNNTRANISDNKQLTSQLYQYIITTKCWLKFETSEAIRWKIDRKINIELQII